MLLASSAWSAILVATVLEPFNSITIIWGIANQLYLTALTPPARRSRIVAVYYTAWYVGNIAGSFLAGHLAQTSWSLVFAAFSGLNLLSGLFLRHLLPGTGRREGVRYRDLLASLFDGRAFLDALRQLRARFRRVPRAYARFSLGIPIRSVGVSMVMPIIAIYLAQVLRAPKLVIATMTSFGMLARIIPAPLVGWIADKWGRKRIFIAGLVATMLYPVIYVSAPDTTLLYPAYALMGLGWACNQATFLAWQMALIPDRRGSSIALLSFLNNFAWAVGPSIGGLLGEFTGIWWGVIASILAEAVGLAVLLRVPEAV
jgi:MFS family permease